MKEERDAMKMWLRELREAQNLSRPDVAEALGVTGETIKHLESPKFGFSNGFMLVRYLRLLGVLAETAPIQTPALGRLAALEEKADEVLGGIGDILALLREAPDESDADAPAGSPP